MDVLHGLAEAGSPAGTAVMATAQTSGRGSRGRRWQSPPGGLWLSVLLRPARAAAELLSLRAGLAIADAMERAYPTLALALKWPNDLMWRGRKLGGVLCEARWTGDAPAWAAVGVGLNVANEIPEPLRATAVSLREGGIEASPDAVLALVLDPLRALDTETARLSAVEYASLGRRDWLRGRRIAEPAEGVADGIGADGALVVRGSDGRRSELRAGTVRLAERGDSP